MNKHIKLVITIIFFGFVILMFSMVFIAIKQKDIHLVSREYYKEEIAYQETIDALSRTPITTVKLNPKGEGVVEVQFDSQSLASRWQGNKIQVQFKRPEDAALDRDTVVNNISALALKGLKPGKWRVRVSWQKDDKYYLWQEQTYL